MDLLFKIFLTLHIAGGSLGLITGTINLARKKGDRRHQLTGKLFSGGMLAAGASALVLSIIHPNPFLFIVGVFTLYLVSTGHRYIYLKMLGTQQRPKTGDWLITLAMLVAGVLFVGFGVKNIVEQNNFGIVLITFGVIGIASVRTDFKNYRNQIKEKNYWLLAHIQRMTAGYIAAATAFLVVNAHHSPVALPAILVWLFPTVILTPLIFKWSRQHKSKTSSASVRDYEKVA